jgi:hypothetical protein
MFQVALKLLVFIVPSSIQIMLLPTIIAIAPTDLPKSTHTCRFKRKKKEWNQVDKKKKKNYSNPNYPLFVKL